ncbi:hypothetical protein J1N35_007377 [Gossypium stocksii]|uniref:Uncharacterized protein n=1 Tax=Gossypium stocksii TaxID=47602 RepID=A0A9D4AF76_9ROSI|nr:hypothetical protein J1N35_007377 [Gossypium stocksii]
MISTIKKKDEPKEEAKPIEKKTSRVNLMMLIPKQRNVLFPWADQIHIVNGLLSKIIVLVHWDMTVGTKVLSSIQLVEYVSYGRNINSIERNATKAPLEKLVEHKTDMRLVESTMELSPLGKMGCVSDFEGKETMQR